MKAAELDKKSSDELRQLLLEILKEQFNLRMRKATGQLNQTHLLREKRRDLARVKTILNSKAGD